MEYIDLRSDTVTVPTQEMRDSILTVECGDDVYEDDPTVNKLQDLACQLLQKEKCLFFPSGTMANQVAIMSIATLKGDEILVQSNSHIYNSESGALSILSGAMIRFFKTNQDDDSIDLIDLENSIHKQQLDFYPRSVAIVVENPTYQGQVISIDNMKKVYEIAQKYNIHVHYDSSRLFNACCYMQIQPQEFAKYCDSIMFCLSKGLCAPVGSLLLGSRDFLLKAKRNRKLIGGTMRQVGVLAGPGIIALTKMIQFIQDDNRVAKLLCDQLRYYLIGQQVIIQMKKLNKINQIKVKETNINMVYIKVENSKKQELQEYLLKRNIKITIPQNNHQEIRLVTHHYIREEQIQIIVKAFSEFYGIV